MYGLLGQYLPEKTIWKAIVQMKFFLAIHITNQKFILIYLW